MDEHFHSSSKLSKSVLQRLMKRSDNPAILRFLLMMALWTVAAYCATLFWSGALWQTILSLFIFGVICCSTFACLHETGHRTAFKSKGLNQVACFICGILHVYPSVAFRELHFTHHRYTHIPGKDPEISFGNHPLPSVITTLPSYLGWLTGLPLLLFKIMMTINGAFGMIEPLRKLMYPFIRPEVRFRLFIESWIFILVYGILIYLALNNYPELWALMVGQVVGHSLLASYLAAEHNGLPHEGDILEKTRSMKTPIFVRWLMWNMPFHAEHHAYPAIPFHALPELNSAMIEELKHKDEDHPQFHKSVIQNLFK